MSLPPECFFCTGINAIYEMFHSFTAPTMTPWMKYFCSHG